MSQFFPLHTNSNQFTATHGALRTRLVSPGRSIDEQAIPSDAGDVEKEVVNDDSSD